MRKNLLVIIFICLSQSVVGQYWFGPKIGLNYINPVYQQDSYERDLYDVDNDFDFNIGVALNYTATDLYSVYTEIVYERMNRDLINKGDTLTLTVSNAVNDFITIPIMLRVSLGQVPFHYYVNGGPKISYWLSGRGSLFLASFEESFNVGPNGEELPIGPTEYNVTFNSKKANTDDMLLLSQPNRLQFGLAIGAGAFFDLVSGARLMIDFRYTFGHSNFGFDDDDDTHFIFEDDSYVESFEYTLNTASVSVGYLFGYNSQFKRKGRSTDRESNKKKKK